jgi:hypothetical protein
LWLDWIWRRQPNKAAVLGIGEGFSVVAFALSIGLLHPKVAIAEEKDPIYGESVQKNCSKLLQAARYKIG